MRDQHHQQLVTAVDTKWHEDQRGFFDLPAGSAVRIVQDLTAAVPDPTERQRLEKLRQREQSGGGDPVLVELGGAVRVLDRCLIRQASARQGQAA